jgi:hypothetical protein
MYRPGSIPGMRPLRPALLVGAAAAIATAFAPATGPQAAVAPLPPPPGGLAAPPMYVSLGCLPTSVLDVQLITRRALITLDPWPGRTYTATVTTRSAPLAGPAWSRTDTVVVSTLRRQVDQRPPNGTITVSLTATAAPYTATSTATVGPIPCRAPAPPPPPIR